MFNTVKEAHIAIEFGLQHITSNRKQSIAPEFIDMALNLSVSKYIASAVNPMKNVRGIGFEHNQVAYDELSPLKKDASLTVFYNNDKNEYFSILPSTYRHHITSKTKIQFNRQLEDVQLDEVTRYKYVMEFRNPTGASVGTGRLYKGFKFKVGEHVIEPNVSIYSTSAKFILINSVLEYFVKHSISGISVYWQRYNDTYEPNSFIVISDTNYNSNDVTLSYTGIRVAAKTSLEILHRVINKSNREAENKIHKSITKNYVTDNTYYNSNSHKQLNISISGNKIIYPHTKTFRPIHAYIDYIKVPTMINYKTDTLSELIINDKIIQLAIQYLKALVKDEGYNHILQENQTI